jgi:hypothetical protein
MFNDPSLPWVATDPNSCGQPSDNGGCQGACVIGNYGPLVDPGPNAFYCPGSGSYASSAGDEVPICAVPLGCNVEP